MMDFVEFQRLKAALEKKKNSADRARWRLEEILGKLEVSLGASSLEEAKEIATERENKLAKEEKTFQRNLLACQEEWSPFLGDIS